MSARAQARMADWIFWLILIPCNVYTIRNVIGEPISVWLSALLVFNFAMLAWNRMQRTHWARQAFYEEELARNRHAVSNYRDRTVDD
jgi:hypothetical protein